MNSIWIILGVLTWLFLGYHIYGRFIEKRLKINDKTKTPAFSNKDKTDYSPSSKPFLVGHHFASIAGAGPIIGPILAVSYFGWLPVVLWIALGSVFIGAMHDYVTLITSVRNKGQGISTIAKSVLGGKSGWIFGLMIWITLVLIITVFSVSAADSFVEKPDLVIPLAAITIIALLLGIIVEKFKINYKIVSIVALIFVFLFVWIGYMSPISLPVSDIVTKNIWVTIIFGYAILASLLPVSILLRPRDYLSALQMLLILGLGIFALIIIRPEINAPLYQSASFPLWPILFITVACGAVSGFHGLVSSGTTSKQISKESHGRTIGYGAMLLEGLLATVVTIVVIAGVTWGTGTESFQLTLEKGWIVLFSTGFGNIIGELGIPLITTGIAALLGAFMVNQFILTSVDTSTRLGRFVISENLFPKLKNKFLTTAITLIPAYLLAITNSYEKLWRLFGTSNQLIASISLITVAAFFISKKIKTKFITLPALFVLITTLSALTYLTFNSQGYFATGEWGLAIISMAMFGLGIIVSFEGTKNILKNK